MVQQIDVHQTQCLSDAAGGFYVLHGGQCRTVGVIVAEHYRVGAALDSRSHHALDLQTHPVRGSFPQPDRRPHPFAAVQTHQHGALVI